MGSLSLGVRWQSLLLRWQGLSQANRKHTTNSSSPRLFLVPKEAKKMTVSLHKHSFSGVKRPKTVLPVYCRTSCFILPSSQWKITSSHLYQQTTREHLFYKQWMLYCAAHIPGTQNAALSASRIPMPLTFHLHSFHTQESSQPQAYNLWKKNYRELVQFLFLSLIFKQYGMQLFL